MLKNGTILFAFGRLENNMRSKLNYHRIGYEIGIVFGIVFAYKIYQKIRDRKRQGQ
jgi:hypothetical protein